MKIIKNIFIMILSILSTGLWLWAIFDKEMFAWGTFLSAYTFSDSLFVAVFAGLMMMITVLFSAFAVIYLIRWLDIFLDEKIEKFIVDKQ